MIEASDPPFAEAPAKVAKTAPWRVRVLREFTDFPATTTIGALWVVVYAAMALHQGTPHAGADWLGGGIQTSTSHLFGDLTSRELYAGQVWRVVTATFVHFSLIHLGLNLVGLYQLGRVVEDWHGSWRFAALYAAIGGMGNALAGYARPWVFRGDEVAWITHSGGGSTAIFGFVTLIGVGAWRSKTRFGDYAKGVALLLLALNAGLAIALRKYLDNLGHAGGAIVGATLGLFQAALNHEPEGRSARRVGWIGIGVLAACAGAQGWADIAEAAAYRKALTLARLQAEEQHAEFRRRNLELLRETVRERTRRGPVPVPVPLNRRKTGREGGRKVDEIPLSLLREAIFAALGSLADDHGDLDSVPTATDYSRVRKLAEKALERSPTPGQYHAFERSWEAVHARATAEVETAIRARQALQPREAKPTPR